MLVITRSVLVITRSVLGITDPVLENIFLACPKYHVVVNNKNVKSEAGLILSGANLRSVSLAKKSEFLKLVKMNLLSVFYF